MRGIKLLASLCLVSMLALLTSCEGPMGPQGPAGEGMNWEVYDFTVYSQDWQLQTTVNDENYYEYTIDNPEVMNKLTEYVAYKGVVGLYIYVDEAMQVQSPLPYTRYYKEGDFYWSEAFDYEFAPGRITIFYTPSDFYVEQPATADFRIIYQW